MVNLDTYKKKSVSSQNAGMDIILLSMWNTSTVILLVFLRSKVSCTYVFSHFLKQLPQLPQVKVSYHFAGSA